MGLMIKFYYLNAITRFYLKMRLGRHAWWEGKRAFPILVISEK
jgi:hypothetical protein